MEQLQAAVNPEMKCCELNSDLLKEQYVLRTIEPPLQLSPSLRLDHSLARDSLTRLGWLAIEAQVHSCLLPQLWENK